MEVRSSNEAPLDYMKILIPHITYGSHPASYISFNTLDIKTNILEPLTSPKYLYHYGALICVKSVAIDYINGDIYTVVGTTASYHYGTYYNKTYIWRYNEQGTILRTYTLGSSWQPHLTAFTRLGVDSSGYVWWFEYGNHSVKILDEALVILTSLSDIQYISVNLQPSMGGAWVLKTTSPGAIKMSHLGVILFTIPESTCTLVAANFDGGCWLYETSTNTLQKFEPVVLDTGELIYEKHLNTGPIAKEGHTCVDIANDYTGTDGVWYVVDRHLIHLSFDNKMLSDTVLPFIPTTLNASPLGVVVKRFNPGAWCFVDLCGTILNQGTHDIKITVGPKALTFDTAIRSGFSILPLSYDPLWGTNGSLQWDKKPLTGYFLPKTKYHQARYTFRTTISGNSPVISSIGIPTPVVIKDIPYNDTRDLYIKTSFTGNEETSEYKTSLKTWWHIQD
jgi:hypothetical protein